MKISVNKIIILSTIVLWSLSGMSQQKTRVSLEHADASKYDETLGKEIERLIGNVVIKQDSTLFYCDSAFINEKLNNFEAFSNVHIKVNDTVDVYGDRLLYDGNTKIAELFENVKLVDKNTILTTEHLIYNRISKTAWYDVGGKIVNKDNTLTSIYGLYFTKTRTFHFRKDVVLINPENEAYSDTLIYNTNTETAFFLGPSIIRGKESTIYTEDGWYDTKNDVSNLSKRPFISNDEQILYADSIYYENDKYFGKAMGNVGMYFRLPIHKVLIKGKKGELWDDQNMAYITDSAMAITYDDQDSLFIHADTMWLTYDENRKARTIKAYYGVRFFRTNLQGKCDSLSYVIADSLIKLYHEPVMWSGKNQLTADSIILAVSDNAVDSLMMYNTAFIVNNDSTDTYNQIRGRDMTAYFTKNELSYIKVFGNAQTVYYAREEDGFLVGIDVAESSSMQISVKDNEIQRIRYEISINENTIPEKEITKEQTTLKGFTWQEDIRPVSKEDIFRKIVILEEED